MELRTTSRPDTSDSERALDRWVRDALDESYGSVVDERVPEAWLRLIEAASPR